MSVQRFGMGRQLVWKTDLYVVKRLLPGSRVVLENLQTAQARAVPFAELAQALFAGELRFLPQGKAAGQAPERPAPALADYPAPLRALAEYRLMAIQPLLDLPSSARTRQAVKARVAAIQHTQAAGEPLPKEAISPASMYRWMRVYTQSGGDLRALMGNSQSQGGKQQARLEADVEALLQAVLADRYFVAERVTTDDIFLEILLRVEEANRLRHAEEKLSAPSRATVGRRIQALDQQQKVSAKRGRRAAQREATQFGKMAYPTLPLERVEIDHTPLDLIVVDGEDNLPLGRPTFTYCVDTATRYPLGFYLGFEPPSYLTVMACLHHAILDKGDVRTRYATQHAWLACGVPTILATDHGKEFIGVDLQDACQALGIQLHYMPIAMPHFKAAVERMFATLNTGLLHTLPGTTFSNPRARGAYPSEARACIDLADLAQALHIFLLDVYAENFHRGLGEVPARRWEAVTQEGFFPRLPASAAELKILLGRVAQRRLWHYGISFQNLRYNAPELAALRHRLGEAPVKIKYDPGDLGALYVYDPEAQTYLEIPCLEGEYARGLSLWKHRVILNLARQGRDQVNQLALARAKRQIQGLVAASRTAKKTKTRSRARLARWETGGQPLARTDSGLPETAASSPSLLLERLPMEVDQVLIEDLESEGWSATYDLPNPKP
jgi:putative transposase